MIQKIGNPDVGGKKWQQPKGTQLWRYNGGTGTSSYLTLQIFQQDQFSGGSWLIRTVTSPNPNPWTVENSILIIENAKHRHASGGWSTAGQNPRLELRVPDTGKGLNGLFFTDEDPVIESPSCNEEDRNYSEVHRSGLIYTYDGSYNFGLAQNFHLGYRDRATVSTTCHNEYDLSILMLLPKAGISSVNTNPAILSNDSMALISEA